MIKPKICVYISTEQEKAILALPRSINMSEKLRAKIDEIIAVYDPKRD